MLAGFQMMSQVPDTAVYRIEGRVFDDITRKPLIYANVYLLNTNIATVTNNEGAFVIKIPRTHKEGELGISFVGYKEKRIQISGVEQSAVSIGLQPNTLTLDEITIRPENPDELVRLALAKIDENYSDKPNLLTSFYRETIKQNRHYVAISEGVLEIYKAPYDTEANDLIKMYKGRKSRDVKRMDTVLFKLQGGPNTTLLLDVVKNPFYLFHEGYLGYFNFEMINITKINDRLNYIIGFEQKNLGEGPIYIGKIYLDIENLAISQIEFELNKQNIKEATAVLVRKKPLTMKVEPISAKYFVNYREIDGEWYFNYARGEVEFSCKWKRKLFKSVYKTMSEIAITDRTEENVEKFNYREIIRKGESFIDKVTYFDDDDFWGKYNYIQPDESIESAINKLNRRLMRRN